MKKIIISLAMIAAVAAVVVGGTTAFFSDEETSTGNTFTAGAIDLTVDSTQHYNGNICTKGDNTDGQYAWQGPDAYPVPGTPCDGTWAATDLGTQKFFNFADVKPGDKGEDTISIHIDNNDAWLRLIIKGVTDLDNTCNEPEAGASGEGCTVATPEGTTPGAGELRENLMFSVFTDANCDNIKNGDDVTIISPGEIDLQGELWTLPTPIKAGSETCFGVEWNLPAGTGNIVQTDSVGATMEFQVQQFRNNPSPWGV
jgi:predicted ribosomally synthesized peptide with SipW-like signal peptide